MNFQSFRNSDEQKYSELLIIEDLTERYVNRVRKGKSDNEPGTKNNMWQVIQTFKIVYREIKRREIASLSRAEKLDDFIWTEETSEQFKTLK